MRAAREGVISGLRTTSINTKLLESTTWYKHKEEENDWRRLRDRHCQQYPHDVYLDFSKALVAAVVLGAGWLPSLAKRKGSNLLQ